MHAEAVDDDDSARSRAGRLREDREHPRASGRREIDGVADDERRDDLLRPALLARVIGRLRRRRRGPRQCE